MARIGNEFQDIDYRDHAADLRNIAEAWTSGLTIGVSDVETLRRIADEIDAARKDAQS
jgi:hypothetical protein